MVSKRMIISDRSEKEAKNTVIKDIKKDDERDYVHKVLKDIPKMMLNRCARKEKVFI